MATAEKHKQRSHRSYRANLDRRDYFTRKSMIRANQRIIAKANHMQTASFMDAVKTMMDNIKSGMKKIVGGNKNG